MIRNAASVIKQVQAKKGERGNWETQWQEVCDFMLPRKSDINSFRSPGDRRGVKILDNTGMVSLELLAGYLHGLLTNPVTLWFEMTSGDLEIDAQDDVRQWLQHTTRTIHTALNNSNFQTEAHEFYLDLCGINTAGTLILDDKDSIFRFQTYFLKELLVSENSKGQIDEVYRMFEWNVRNIVQEFGLKNCPEVIQKQFKDDKFETMHEIIHAIYPVDHLSGEKKRGFRFPIVSQYIYVKDKVNLRVAGFNEFPAAVARWAKASGEVYGRGPGMNALPEVKMVNLMEETMIRGAQKAIDPPVQAPDDGFVLPIRLRPGGINYYRAGGGGKDKIEPIFADTRLDFGDKMMESRRMRIRQAFYTDQLQINVGDRATATEVNKQSDQQAQFMGPLLGRLEVEWLSQMFGRIYPMMTRRNAFKPLPAILKKRKLEVRFSSAIAKVLRAGENRAILESFHMLAPLAQIDPNVLDIVDVDAAGYGILQRTSFPQEFLRDKKALTDRRKAKADAQAQALKQQQEAHQAEVAAKVLPPATQLAQASKDNQDLEEA